MFFGNNASHSDREKNAELTECRRLFSISLGIAIVNGPGSPDPELVVPCECEQTENNYDSACGSEENGPSYCLMEGNVEADGEEALADQEANCPPAFCGGMTNESNSDKQPLTYEADV